jgi:hypothetical protein
MILPGKHLKQDRALLTVGAEILSYLDEPRSVSELWEGIRQNRESHPMLTPLSFDWFILSLNLLFAINALELSGGLVVATRKDQ